MEMPTVCEHCREWFDLDDGYASLKWHRGITICSNCYDKERAEIEYDEKLEDARCVLGDSMVTIKDVVCDVPFLFDAGYTYLSGSDLKAIIQQLEFCNFQTSDGHHNLKMNASFVTLKEFSECCDVVMIGKKE